MTVESYFEKLKWLSTRLGWCLFEPTPAFYSLLDSGEEEDLRKAAASLALHIGVPPLQRVSYEWGMTMPLSAAGRIFITPEKDSNIQIPLFYVGKSVPLGAILAHELSHQLLAVNRIWLADEQENEELTDAASIIAGLGKLVLNGTVTEIADDTGDVQLLGYLPVRTKVRLFCKVNSHHHLSEYAANVNLTDGTLALLKQYV